MLECVSSALKDFGQWWRWHDLIYVLRYHSCGTWALHVERMSWRLIRRLCQYSRQEMELVKGLKREETIQFGDWLHFGEWDRSWDFCKRCSYWWRQRAGKAMDPTECWHSVALALKVKSRSVCSSPSWSQEIALPSVPSAWNLLLLLFIGRSLKVRSRSHCHHAVTQEPRTVRGTLQVKWPNV